MSHALVSQEDQMLRRLGLTMAKRPAMVVAEIEGNVNDAGKRWDALKPSYTGQIDGLTVRAAGTIPILQETNKTVEEDLQAGEKIAFPVLFLALILVFGSLVAAFIP